MEKGGGDFISTYIGLFLLWPMVNALIMHIIHFSVSLFQMGKNDNFFTKECQFAMTLAFFSASLADKWVWPPRDSS